jgi:hypothetical protein
MPDQSMVPKSGLKLGRRKLFLRVQQFSAFKIVVAKCERPALDRLPFVVHLNLVIKDDKNEADPIATPRRCSFDNHVYDVCMCIAVVLHHSIVLLNSAEQQVLKGIAAKEAQYMISRQFDFATLLQRLEGGSLKQSRSSKRASCLRNTSTFSS